MCSGTGERRVDLSSQRVDGKDLMTVVGRAYSSLNDQRMQRFRSKAWVISYVNTYRTRVRCIDGQISIYETDGLLKKKKKSC